MLPERHVGSADLLHGCEHGDAQPTAGVSDTQGQAGCTEAGASETKGQRISVSFQSSSS